MTFRALLPIAALLLASCAASPDRLTTPLHLGLLDAGVHPSTVERIEALQPLDYSHILDLSDHGISDPAILDYLRATGTPTGVTRDQLVALSKAGAGPSLVNHLAGSPDHDDKPGAAAPTAPHAPPDRPRRIPARWHDAGFVFDTI